MISRHYLKEGPFLFVDLLYLVLSQCQLFPSCLTSWVTWAKVYSKMDQVKFAEAFKKLEMISSSIFLKTVFHKFYSVRSWIPWPTFLPKIRKKECFLTSILCRIIRKPLETCYRHEFRDKLLQISIFTKIRT